MDHDTCKPHGIGMGEGDSWGSQPLNLLQKPRVISVALVGGLAHGKTQGPSPTTAPSWPRAGPFTNVLGSQRESRRLGQRSQEWDPALLIQCRGACQTDPVSVEMYQLCSEDWISRIIQCIDYMLR